MCGRFTLHTERDVVAETFQVDLSGLENYEPRFNIAPQQDVLTLVASEAGLEPRHMRWGLIPYWAKPLAKLPSMINARIETVAEKPAYRDAFRRRRCVVLADGFYEWQGSDRNRPKQPFWIHRRDHAPFAMAGVWDRWTGGDTESAPLISCSVVTAPSNAAVAAIHPRMPVILRNERVNAWLSHENDGARERLLALLKPVGAEELASHPVSPEVNNPSHHSPQLIEETRPDQSSLF